MNNDMNNDKKQQILKRCNALRIDDLINFINEGIVTLEELQKAGLNTVRENAIKQRIKAEEEAEEAEQRKEQMIEKYNEIVEELRKDANAYSALELQEMVENSVITWSDIAKALGEDKQRAIQDFVVSTHLPNCQPPHSLQPNSTEVYFWGTPSSGKTCVLGATISSSQYSGILEMLQCSGYDYMTRLSNIFSSEGICTLPENTHYGNIYEMVLNLTDHKKRKHKLTLIDLGGELFRYVYFKQNRYFLDQEQKDTLTKAISYLKDTRNEKIHFFVVEYGAHNKEWESLSMLNYLDCMATFLKEERVFKKSTVGVYILVTKCDRILCEEDKRAEEAYNYVKDKMPSFYNNLEATCKDAGISDFKVISFSVGEVFAQNFCQFNDEDTNKIINKLVTKTYAESNSWWAKLFRILRG